MGDSRLEFPTSLPTEKEQGRKSLREALAAYIEEFGQKPNEEELSALLGVSISLIRLSLEAANVNVMVPIDSN